MQVLQPVAVRETGDSSVARLAEFFPSAIRVRIPVEVELVNANTSRGGQTVIEFGTAHEVLFASELPLEFHDQVRLTNLDGSLNAEGRVVALQFGSGRMAVAVRFNANVANWIIKSAPGKLCE